MASAGVTHAITAACARGNITLCGCDRHYKSTPVKLATPEFGDKESFYSPPDVNEDLLRIRGNLMSTTGIPSSQPWKWGGCSADIEFGMKYARKFLDAREIEGDTRSLMNLHNNRAGRRVNIIDIFHNFPTHLLTRLSIVF